MFVIKYNPHSIVTDLKLKFPRKDLEHDTSTDHFKAGLFNLFDDIFVFCS